MSSNEKSFPYPGTPVTADGSSAVVWVETHIGEGSCSYPITPSTSMGAGFQLAVSNGQKNHWDRALYFMEPESEHSSASACEGYALAGGRICNFTSGQGLVLMTEVLYTIAGKRLPAVFHIGARALTSHSLNVHAGHDDVMSVNDVGWGMLFARNAQEAHDFALICRRAAEKSYTPFMNIQDGFLTTHTIERILQSEPDMMAEFVGSPASKIRSLFDTQKPLMTGVVQNQDSYMKGKIAQRYFYDMVPGAIEDAFAEFYRLSGRKYSHLDGYQLEDAEYVIVGLGSVMDTTRTAVDYMRDELGWKAGALNITTYRPFPAIDIVRALSTCKAAAVIERLDVPLAKDNPLTTEIKASFADAMMGINGQKKLAAIPRIYSGVYGLGSRDVRVGDIVATVENMIDEGKTFFSLGIEHPTSLERKKNPDVRPAGAFSMRGHSIGGYGSVTTNKVIASLVEDIFSLNVQAYPKYGSEKKGLPTTYYLTVADGQIWEHSELEHVDFVPLNDANAFNSSDPLVGLVDNGYLFMQSIYEDQDDVWAQIPERFRVRILEKNLRLFFLDTAKIAREVASTPDLELRMQGVVLLGIFLRLAPFVREKNLNEDKLFESVEKTLRKYFGRRGDQVVLDNLFAVKCGFNDVKEMDFSTLRKQTPAAMT